VGQSPGFLDVRLAFDYRVNTGEIYTPGKRWYFDRYPVHRQLQHRGWRYLRDYIAIEGKYDDNPTEMGWGLLRIALVL
jgi:hypothetical protein